MIIKPSRLAFILIVYLVVINFWGLGITTLEVDAALYAKISKELFLSHGWSNLTLNGVDWLDKPHFPFWITKISFMLFGVNTFAYLLPGYVFGLIGAYYTYRLAEHLFNQQTALIALIMYLSTRHIMLFTSVDIRAEAYLIGQVIPACYYWLLYHEQSKIRYLFAGAFFSAIAVMTKGVFLVVPIFSGLIILVWSQKELRQIISWKWLFAALLCLLFILPEIITLYTQFDLHPEKVVFGRTGVSGVIWFFVGSQFGRFFNFGPIHQDHTDYFDFLLAGLPDMLLPWTLMFIITVVMVIIKIKRNMVSKQEKNGFIFLGASFIPMFVLFSLSHFHQTYYIIFLFPFVLILSAEILCSGFLLINKKIIYLQYVLTIVLILLSLLGIGVYVYITKLFMPVMILMISFGMLIFVCKYTTGLYRLLYTTSVAGSLLFMSMYLEHQLSLKDFNPDSYFVQFLPKNQTAIVVLDQANISPMYLSFLAKDVLYDPRDEVINKLQKPIYVISHGSNLSHWQRDFGNGELIASYAIPREDVSFQPYQKMLAMKHLMYTNIVNDEALIMVKIN